MSLLDPPQSLRRADPDELVAAIVSSATRFERMNLAEVERVTAERERVVDLTSSRFADDRRNSQELWMGSVR